MVTKLTILKTLNIKKMKTDFFDNNSYFIDQKVHFLKFENIYQIYDEEGQIIGIVSQKLTKGQKLLVMLMSNTNLPFLIEIRNTNDELLFSLTRSWTFFLSKVNILDAGGIKLGHIQQTFRIIKPLLKIFDNSGSLIAEISGDWKAWNFVIRNAEGAQIGSITKKWAGAMKEIFTTADKYNVSVDSHYSNKENKRILLASAVSIDMILKEKK
jgi:uncharacterized protein YxjI